MYFAGSTMSIMPTQKIGSDSPRIATDLATWSAQPSGFRAAITPTSTPQIQPNATASASVSRVVGRRRWISSVTGFFVQ